jgi:hypothetical protein
MPSDLGVVSGRKRSAQAMSLFSSDEPLLKEPKEKNYQDGQGTE